MNAVQTRNTVSYSVAAKAYLYHLPEPIANYIRRSIATLAQEPMVSRQMVVMNMTCNLPDHIWRAMKVYAYPPGYRIIFHREPGNVVYIDKIARRDQNPYGDGG
jgi:hypothetical protein